MPVNLIQKNKYMDTNTETPKTNGKANGAASNGNTQASRDEIIADNAKTNVAYRIQNAIDDKGRYAFRLKDMAAGFAAAEGISPMAAKMKVEEIFTQKMNMTPHAYLDQHFDEMRKNGVAAGTPYDDGEELSTKKTYRKSRGR